MSRFKAISTTAVGIKCDNPHCNWCDMTIPSKDYATWVDMPCPKCGENLMTKANYRLFRRLMWIIRIVNVIWFPVMVVRWVFRRKNTFVRTKVDSRPDGSAKLVTIMPDGDSKVTNIPPVK